MTDSIPKQGDTFWTILRRVTKSNNIIADSPYNRHVHVDKESVESRTPIEVPHRPIKSPSAIDPNINQAAFVKVVSVESQAMAEVVDIDEWPDRCPRSLNEKIGEVNPTYKNNESLFENDRTGRVEWDGTPQKIDPNRNKQRNETFSEADIRGSKNDLL